MPIGDTARSAIWDYLQEREALMPRTKALWVSEQGEALLPNGISQLLSRLARRANIEGMHPHRFRHSYAINALRAGMPEQVLKIVGGWRKIPETYFKTLGEEDVIEFHRQVSPGGPAGEGAVRAEDWAAGPTAGKALKLLAQLAWQFFSKPVISDTAASSSCSFQTRNSSIGSKLKHHAQGRWR